MTTDAELAARIESLKKGRSAAPQGKGGRGKQGRRHAARKSRLAAAFLSIASTAGLGTAFFFMDATAQTQAAFSALPTAITPGRATTVVVPPLGTPVRTGAVGSETAASAPIEVEAFNGRQVDTRYGPVQVQVQVQRGTGEIADVVAVRFPDGDSTSRGISAQVLPRLRSSALTAQSAEVDAVSGATYTTRAYKESLQSAIDAARSETAVVS